MKSSHDRYLVHSKHQHPDNKAIAIKCGSGPQCTAKRTTLTTAIRRYFEPPAWQVGLSTDQWTVIVPSLASGDFPCFAPNSKTLHWYSFRTEAERFRLTESSTASILLLSSQRGKPPREITNPSTNSSRFRSMRMIGTALGRSSCYIHPSIERLPRGIRPKTRD